jgi:hypothetical protein
MATVRDVLASLTDEQLAGMTRPVMTRPVTEPGNPEPESFPVSRCLRAILDEEWQHRLYAERDLDALSPSLTRSVGLEPLAPPANGPPRYIYGVSGALVTSCLNPKFRHFDPARLSCVLSVVEETLQIKVRLRRVVGR